MKKIRIAMSAILCFTLLSGCSIDITVRDENGSSIAIPDGVDSAIENAFSNVMNTSSSKEGSSTTQSTAATGESKTSDGAASTTSTVNAPSKATNSTTSTQKTPSVQQNIPASSKYITGISINKMPNKTTYISGDQQLNTTGLTINRLYSDGSSDTISSGFRVMGFNTRNPGTKKLTIVYEHENGSVLTCEYSINVKKKQHDTPNIENKFHHDKENEVLKLINEVRKKAGLNELKMDNGKMMNAADIRAKEITIDFEHERPDHDKWDTVYDEEGASYNTRGENLGKNAIPTDENSVVQGIFDAWMNSTEHKKNILNPAFTHVSIACLEHKGHFYWVQLFGANG